MRNRTNSNAGSKWVVTIAIALLLIVGAAAIRAAIGCMIFIAHHI